MDWRPAVLTPNARQTERMAVKVLFADPAFFPSRKSCDAKARMTPALGGRKSSGRTPRVWQNVRYVSKLERYAVSVDGARAEEMRLAAISTSPGAVAKAGCAAKTVLRSLRKAHERGTPEHRHERWGQKNCRRTRQNQKQGAHSCVRRQEREAVGRRPAPGILSRTAQRCELGRIGCQRR